MASSTFVVSADGDGLLVNEIGTYSGARPLPGSGPVLVQVIADGAWTIDGR